MKKKRQVFLCIVISIAVQAMILQVAAQGLAETLAAEADIIVSQDGTGDYEKVQDAIDNAPDFSSERTVIFIKNGSYKEKLVVPSSKENLAIIGEDVDSTLLTYDDHARRVVDGSELGTFESYTMKTEADDLWLMNLTIKNSSWEDFRDSIADIGQAVALHMESGDRNVLYHVRMVAWQDTYYTGGVGRTYVKDSYIEGAVDYIFGEAVVVFDSCQIHTVRDGGYVTAGSTEQGYDFGYVFMDSWITGGIDIGDVYLGRPWKNHPKTVFYECYEGENIRETGWRTWDGTEDNALYAEYNCFGPGYTPDERVDWSRQLTEQEASDYTISNIFSSGTSSNYSADWEPGLDGNTLYEAIKANTTPMLDSSNQNSGIVAFKYNGEEFGDFDPNQTEYTIELEAGTTEMPMIDVITEDEDALVQVENPESLPGYATVTVLAYDRRHYKRYKVYYSVNNAYSNAKLDSIIINREPLPEFDPETYEYDVVLGENASVYFPLSAYRQIQDAQMQIERPSDIPGALKIVVTAVDGKTTNTYTLNLGTGTAINHDKVGDQVSFVNPIADRIQFWVNPASATDIVLQIYTLNGLPVALKKYDNLSAGKHTLYYENNLKKGLYMYELYMNDSVYKGKLLKTD